MRRTRVIGARQKRRAARIRDAHGEEGILRQSAGIGGQQSAARECGTEDRRLQCRITQLDAVDRQRCAEFSETHAVQHGPGSSAGRQQGGAPLRPIAEAIVGRDACCQRRALRIRRRCPGDEGLAAKIEAERTHAVLSAYERAFRGALQSIDGRQLFIR